MNINNEIKQIQNYEAKRIKLLNLITVKKQYLILIKIEKTLNKNMVLISNSYL